MQYSRENNPINTNQTEADDWSDSEEILSSVDQRKVLLTTVTLEKNPKLAKICFMLVVVFERSAYYSLVANLAYFLIAYLKYNNLQSVVMTQAFLCMTWISCIIGGILGDFILGRFRTIVAGFFIYIVGFGMLSCIQYFAYGNDATNRGWFIVWVFFSLLIISLGEGCFKSNMSPFGADQLTDIQDVELKIFFNYYYWAINIGALIGYFPMTYLQEKCGFIIGYLVSASLLVTSLIAFYITQINDYNLKMPSDRKLMKKLIKICCNARRKSDTKHANYESYVPIQHWLDRAKIMHGGKYSDSDIEDIKGLFSVLPTLFFITLYCTGYYQVSSLYLVQGIHMNVLFDSKSFPAAWLGILNMITVLIFVPITDKLHSCFLKQQVYLHYVFRMSVGMILGALSLYAAGTVEYYRVNNKNIVINTFDKNTTVKGVNMTIFYQIPQYMLMGLSEIFVIIAGLQYAYCQSPKSMQSFVTSLFFLVNGLGAFLSTIFILVGNALKLEVLVTSNQSLSGKLYNYFYFLGFLNVFNLIGFLVYAWFKKRHLEKCELSKNMISCIEDSEAKANN